MYNMFPNIYFGTIDLLEELAINRDNLSVHLILHHEEHLPSLQSVFRQLSESIFGASGILQFCPERLDIDVVGIELKDRNSRSR